MLYSNTLRALHLFWWELYLPPHRAWQCVAQRDCSDCWLMLPSCCYAKLRWHHEVQALSILSILQHKATIRFCLSLIDCNLISSKVKRITFCWDIRSCLSGWLSLYRVLWHALDLYSVASSFQIADFRLFEYAVVRRTSCLHYDKGIQGPCIHCDETRWLLLVSLWLVREDCLSCMQITCEIRTEL